MKTKEELLAMGHEDLASLTYKIMYEQCLLENKEKENKRLREILELLVLRMKHSNLNSMNDELQQLEAELKKVESSNLEYIQGKRK